MTQNGCPRKKLIIDTDCGVDDAMAIMLALSYEDNWEIIAITCCYGNTSVGNVCENVKRVLVACGRTEIPIYSGCQRPLITRAITDAEHVHGADGLGGVATQFPTGGLQVGCEHSANALVNLAKEHKDEVYLVILGPHTNIALAYRLDHDFSKNLKGIFLMGGNCTGVGNITATAEFNFAVDPESAHIVLTEAQCPVTLIPWETCYLSGAEWDWMEKWLETDTGKGRFIKRISKHLITWCQKAKDLLFSDCDFMAMAALVCPDSVSKVEEYPIQIELSGFHTRGQTVIDKRPCTVNNNSKQRKIRIVTELNSKLLNELRQRLLK